MDARAAKTIRRTAHLLLCRGIFLSECEGSMRILHPGRFCGTPLCHPMFHGGHLARAGRCDTTFMPFDSAKCSPLSRPPTAQRCEPETGREQDFSLFKLVFGARLLRRNVPILSRYAREKWRFSSGL